MTASIYPAGPHRPDGGHASQANVAPVFPGQEPSQPLLSAAITARAWLDVDLDAVRHNAATLRARAGVPIVAMVKADGYGVGANAVAVALGVETRTAPANAEAPWALGVATVAEGVSLRDAGIGGRILCFSPVLHEEFNTMHAARMTPTLHDATSVKAWRALTTAPWHLAIDTGMNRAGVRWDEAQSVRALVGEHHPEGIFTHFHSADSSNDSRVEQERRFAHALEQLDWRHACPAALLHADNSHGVAARTPSPFHLARPGLSLYGCPSASSLSLAQVMHLRARIIDLHRVPAGDTVSYLATWTAPSTRTIATIGIGHGDGYRRSLSNVGEVLLHGTRCPIVGIVAMDMCMIDVTDVVAAVGDVVTLIGRDGDDLLTVDEVAARAQLSAYEMLVGLALRVPRRYTGGRP